MKINDVVTLMEFGFGPPGSRAMGTGNFALLHRAYVNKRPRLSRNLQLDFGNNQVIELDDADIEAVANHYDTLPTDQDRYAFVYDVMSRGDKFNSLLQKLNRRTGTPEQPNLLERDSKKNPNTDLDRSSVRSAALSTALRQAYARYPQARSDMEALLMYDMDVQKNTGQELQSQTKINQRQDDVDVQLRDVTRKQSNKISSLDDENDALSDELDKLSRELDAMHRQTGAEPERKKDSGDSKKSDSATGSRDYGVNVQSTARAEKSQQRAADAEKRKPEPEEPPSQQNLASTVPAYIPPPRPIINVIDRPDPSAAMGQMAQQLTNPPVAEPLTNPPVAQTDTELPAKFGEPAEPDVDQSQADLFGEPAPPKADSPIPTKLSAVDAEEEPPLPANVSDLDQARRTRDQLRQATAQQARDAIRTGTFESQELRRMRELAGLRVNEADSFYTPPVPGVFAIRVNAQFINDYSPSYRPENPEILWNGLSTVFPRDYPRVKFGTPNCPQADVFAELKDRTIADVKTGLTQDMAETLAERLGKSDPTGQLSRFIQLIKKRA